MCASRLKPTHLMEAWEQCLWLFVCVCTSLVIISINTSTDIPMMDLTVGAGVSLFVVWGFIRSWMDQDKSTAEDEAEDEAVESFGQYFLTHHDLCKCFLGQERVQGWASLGMSAILYLFFKVFVFPTMANAPNGLSLVVTLVRSWERFQSALWALLCTKLSRITCNKVVFFTMRQPGESTIRRVIFWVAVVALVCLAGYLVVLHEFRYFFGRHKADVMWSWFWNWMYALLAMETSLCFVKYKLRVQLHRLELLAQQGVRAVKDVWPCHHIALLLVLAAFAISYCGLLPLIEMDVSTSTMQAHAATQDLGSENSFGATAT